MRGYPVGTVAAYGPDDKSASKLVASVKNSAAADPEMRRWFPDQGDVRHDPTIAAEVLAFFEEAGVKSVATVDRIIGLPARGGYRLRGRILPAMHLLDRSRPLDRQDGPLTRRSA